MRDVTRTLQPRFPSGLLWHLWVTRPLHPHAWTPALMLHLSTHALSRKVLNLTTPKGIKRNPSAVILHRLHTVKWFQVFLCNTNNLIFARSAMVSSISIKNNSFYLALIICLQTLCLFVCLFGFSGISIFLGYLIPNPFLYKETVLFQTIQYSISTHLNCQNFSISSYSV